MTQLSAIIVREITQKHKYRWHVTIIVSVAVPISHYNSKELVLIRIAAISNGYFGCPYND